MDDHQATHGPHATAPAWSEPPEEANEWPLLFAPPAGDGYDGDGRYETMPEPSSVYWPFP
jgi:hypothetical protein